jgi:hypothetical protein
VASSGNKREAAALALAGGATLRQASKRCGVGLRTLARWHSQDAAFKGRVAELKAQAVARAVARLSQLGFRAARELGALLKDSDARVRLSAARSVLELGTKLRESCELEERLAELEKRLADSKGN